MIPHAHRRAWHGLGIAGRLFFSALYFGSALFNASYTLWHREVFSFWSQEALVPLYRDLLSHVIVPLAPLFVLQTVAYEVLLGTLLLKGGLWARAGLVGGVVFNIALAPLWSGQLLPNLGLAAVQAVLLLGRHDVDLIAVMRARRVETDRRATSG